MINVTKTYLPKKDKYIDYINKIFDSGWITNNGPLIRKLEKELANYLGVKNIVLVSNGTSALEVAYRALDIKGFALTTPFSFVATTSSLITNNISPIYVDINPFSLNIDENKIESFITPNTEAIVATHIFGNACDIEKIDSIAKKYNLKTVYDAAHAFDVKYKNNSILNYGDISILSFHATKIFHTIEGGALIINDDSLVEKVRYLINFGIKNEESIPHLGINAKMNEFEAAMGLCMIEEISNIKNKRKIIYEKYIKELVGLVKFQEQNKHSSPNYSYFPIILKDEKELKKLQKALNKNDIFPRRYFYPSLDSLDYIEPKQNSPISRELSKKVLALPIYPELEEKDQNIIINIIKNSL